MATPLRQMARPLFPEDEPVAQPEQEGFQPAQHVPPGDPAAGGATQALIQQSQAVTALVAHLIGQESFVDLSSGSSSSLSTKGTAKREKLQSDLAHRSGNFMLLVAQAAFRRMRPTDALPQTLKEFQSRSLFTRYFEKQGGYQSQGELALVQWMMAHIADCLLAEDTKRGQELVSLGMVMIDQACQDGGKWEVAYLLGLLEDPPPGLYAPRGRSTNPRLAAFSPICPQPWATTTLSFIKDGPEKTTQGRRGDRQASTQEEASEVPEKAKARPGLEVEDGGRGCCMLSGDLYVPGFVPARHLLILICPQMRSHLVHQKNLQPKPIGIHFRPFLLLVGAPHFLVMSCHRAPLLQLS